MLDEPFAGIDPVTVQSIQVIIAELAADGIAILITDHAAREILQITNKTYVVSEGKILVSGTTEEIVQHEEVKSKYLGEIELQTNKGPRPPKIQFTKKERTNQRVRPRESPFRKTDL